MSRKTVSSVGALTLGVSLLGACGSSDGSDSTGTTTTASATSSTPAAQGPAAPAKAPIAISHVHSLARDPKTGELLIATHEGLLRLAGNEVRQDGPTIDLMSFAVGQDGTYYASGHPGQDTGLPQPAGLITSDDAGKSWKVASRGGESDFHALAIGPKIVTGFDGALRTTTDRQNWQTPTIAAPPRDLAASPKSGALLATTQAGLLLSKDSGATWETLSPPQVAFLVSWADEKTIVAVTTEGQLAISEDAGKKWTLQPKPIGAAEALYAGRTDDGKLEIIAAVDGKVVQSTDGGATTQTIVE